MEKYGVTMSINPYRSFYSDPRDQVITLVLTLIALTIVGSIVTRRVRQCGDKSERYCQVLGYSLLILNAAIFFNSAIGYVFLLKFTITTGFWFIWEVLYFMSVVVVFWILPVPVVGLCLWALTGKSRRLYQPRTIKVAAMCFAALLVNGLFYFVMEKGFQSKEEADLRRQYGNASIEEIQAKALLVGRVLPDGPLLDLDGKQVKLRARLSEANLTVVVLRPLKNR